MKLYSMNVIITMTKCHDLTFIAHSGDFQTGREIGSVYHPTMITPHDNTFGKSVEDRICAELRSFCGNTVINIREIGQLATKHLPYCLMAETYAKNRFLA